LGSAADRSAMAAFFNFVALGKHAPEGHGMPDTQNCGQARLQTMHQRAFAVAQSMPNTPKSGA